MEIKAEIKYGNIEKVIEAVSKECSIKVGLLASKGGADEVSENLDLAGLGAVQEFGCVINVTPKMRAFFRHNFGVYLKKEQITIPPRSFLKMPLERSAELRKKIKSKILDGDAILDYIARTGDIESVAILIGASAVEQIQEAFETQGFGQWEPNSPLTIAEKGSSMPLIGTGKHNAGSGSLRRSITFEVEKNG